VHFLEPQLVEQVAPRRGEVQGFRTFTYVVELSEPGEQDLGEITLPYWDPKARAYGVARAALGSVKVTGSAKPASATPAGVTSGPRLKGLVTPAPKLSLTRAASPGYWPSRPGYWLLLVGLPLSTLLAFGLSDAARALRKRLSEQRGSLATAQTRALAQLTAAAGAGDVAATASAAERALVIAVERATALKARGVLKSELAARLAEAGVSRDVADDAAQLLARCDELRFAGEALDLRDFAARVSDVCGKLSRVGSRKKSGEAA